ncbi:MULTISPECIES: hypothetical protein [unclassified Streptomyces]|uniref:hypothetical protein n=1 Tax=unclassified Streptomyces TaxID=2593676 RepID=UPI002258A69E|nr:MULTISPECIES: hypothetical protein [unclassified Streptomyces]MCX5151469.1 hypothetical protein [Streptomyces sp. NBC_00320]WSR29144.1 hypothetical protein OG573_41925 [Streptomyces sp. NBC_01205]
MKHYPAEFKANAVAPYTTRPKATIRQATAELGANPQTLQNSIRNPGTGRGRDRAKQSVQPQSPLEAKLTAT